MNEMIKKSLTFHTGVLKKKKTVKIRLSKSVNSGARYLNTCDIVPYKGKYPYQIGIQIKIFR